MNTQIRIQSTKLICMDFCATGACKVVLTALLWHQIFNPSLGRLLVVFSCATDASPMVADASTSPNNFSSVSPAPVMFCLPLSLWVNVLCPAVLG